VTGYPLGDLLPFALQGWTGDQETDLSRWDPPPVPTPAYTGGEGEYLPLESRVVFPNPPPVPVHLYIQPALALLLLPSAGVVLIGLVEAWRSSARRRPWLVPPGDALLLLGLGSAVCIAILRIESAFLERAMVLMRLGPRGPSMAELIDGGLRASAPAAAVLWVGTAILALGLLDRPRARPGGAAGSP